MTSKFSRAALIASLAVGAGGLVAAPAEAANGISTPNYYVNNPAVTGASSVTPESAVVSGAIDTGGNPETLLPVPTGGLTWEPNVVIGGGIKWSDNTTGNYVPVDGIPVSGSNSNVSVTVTDSGDTAISGVPRAVSNGGADNYSDVTFVYDPVSDYVANGDNPGVDVASALAIEVPTTTGISSVSTTIGAFGQAAQSNTSAAPLVPGTKYYYWIQQVPGATDAATNINISQWAGNKDSSGNPANNSYKCYPNAAIAADPTLSSYTTSTMITYGGQTLPAIQAPCTYYYGNTGGAITYQSPLGEFTTPKLGKLVIAHSAKVTGSSATLAISNASAFKASGTIQLTKGSATLASAKFGLAANGKAVVKLKLTAKGRKALEHHTVAKLALTSNWDQPTSTKSVKL